MSRFTDEEIIRVLVTAPYRFAKTMPSCPHSYTLRKEWDDEWFEAAVELTRRLGKRERWGKAIRPYFRHGEYKYWTMGSPINDTILINRAFIADYPNQQPIDE